MKPEQFDEAVRPLMRPIMDNYLAGHPVAAVDGIFSVIFGPDWRAGGSPPGPGGPQQTGPGAATPFASPVRPRQPWRLRARQTPKIPQPGLLLTRTHNP